MIGFARRGRVVAIAALIALAAFLCLGAAGCGSSHDGTATDGSTDGSTAAAPPAGRGGGTAGSAGGGATAAAPGGNGQGSARSGDAAPSDGEGGRQPVAGGHTAAAGQTRKQADHPSEDEGKGAVGDHKVSKACPSSASRSQCEALVEGYEQSKGAPSYAVTRPEDCLKTMSRDECEVLLTAQKAAAESGTSVDVQECLRNPTPTCEAIVRPLLEQQRAAEEAAK